MNTFEQRLQSIKDDLMNSENGVHYFDAGYDRLSSLLKTIESTQAMTDLLTLEKEHQDFKNNWEDSSYNTNTHIEFHPNDISEKDDEDVLNIFSDNDDLLKSIQKKDIETLHDQEILTSIEVYEEMLQTPPNDTKDVLFLMRLYGHMAGRSLLKNDITLTQEYKDKADQVNKDHSRSIMEYGSESDFYHYASYLLKYQSDIEGGLAIVNEGLQRFPYYEGLLFLKAQGLFYQKKYDEALYILNSLTITDAPFAKMAQQYKTNIMQIQNSFSYRIKTTVQSWFK